VLLRGAQSRSDGALLTQNCIQRGTKIGRSDANHDPQRDQPAAPLRLVTLGRSKASTGQLKLAPNGAKMGQNARPSHIFLSVLVSSIIWEVALEVSFLTIEEELFEVKATAGDTSSG
jgi:hypothetical protein